MKFNPVYWKGIMQPAASSPAARGNVYGYFQGHKVAAAYLLLFALSLFPPLLIWNEELYRYYSVYSLPVWNLIAAGFLTYTVWELHSAKKPVMRSWLLLALAIYFYTLGDISWLILEQFLHIDPFPSIADAFYLLSYPLFLISIFLMPFEKAKPIERSKLLVETTTVMLSMGMFLWVLFLRPAIQHTGTSDLLFLGSTLAYPIFDQLLLGASWILITRRSQAIGYTTKLNLVFAFLLIASADTLFLIQDLHGRYFETIRWTDLAYVWSNILLGMAGLQEVARLKAKDRKTNEQFVQLFPNVHRHFAELATIFSFILLVISHEIDLKVNFVAVSLWVGLMIILSITLQRLDGREIKQLNKQLQTLNLELEQRVEARTAELQTANSNLEMAMRTKDEFLSAVSHELRTPLTCILGMAETLEEYGTLNEKDRNAVRLMHNSGKRQLELVNDLLNYSQLQTGKLSVDPAICSLTEICATALNNIKETAHKREQRISFSASPETIKLRTDPRWIKNILAHLLNNASKFTQPGGEFGITVHGDAIKRQVTITVWDKGIGIKTDDLPRLFKPFTQLDAKLARKYEGTGLGLAISQGLAALIDTHINVSSQVGEGSQFSLTLPWPEFKNKPIQAVPLE